MSADEPTLTEERYADLFAAGEEALARGPDADPPCPEDASAEVQQRLRRDLACVGLLRQVLRPAETPSSTSPDGAGDSSPPQADGQEPSPELPWRSLGRFKLRRELGRGGMGVVYLAFDPALNREVALKVPRAEVALTPELRSRFHTEARAAAGLEHANLVPVYEAGEVGPVCFLVSAYCPGLSLADWLREQTEPVPLRRAAELVAELAEGMAHAHARGVVHRDLKPANVLLTPEGTPKVTDFGLAKVAQEAGRGQTHSGAVVGTARYMAPEQARGRSKEVGPVADVWALGAILYECLTGRPPFVGETDLETLQQVCADEPLSPRRLRPRVPRDLETICLKCLQKEPAWRYSSADALAEDLRRFLEGRPIRARRVGVGERLWRWCRRNPTLAVASVLVLTALGVAGWSAYEVVVAERQRLAEQKSHDETLRTEKRQYALEKALLAAMSGDFDGAEEATAEAELLGASTGQVRLLRGQMAFHQGEVSAAISHLEQAVKLMPDSVAARAMLALAYYHSHYSPRFEQICRELDRMSPSTAEDYLFKGQLETIIQPQRSLRTLDQALRERNSVIARAVRAQGRANVALHTGDQRDADLALEDAMVARGMLPDNPFVLAHSVYAHLGAATLYEGADRLKDRDRALEQAKQDVQKLMRFSESPLARRACFCYFAYVGDDEAAYEMSRHGTEFRLVPMLYLRGDYKEALLAADRAINRGYGIYRVERAFTLAEQEDGPRLAWEVYLEAVAQPERFGWDRLAPPMIPLFLGKSEEARRASLKIRENPELVPPWFGSWYSNLLDYHCDTITAAELMRIAGPSRQRQCGGHFAIALHRLAGGDRAGAREHFRKCADTRVLFAWAYIWARAFLARMEKDPAWPPWIPVKE